MGSKGTDEVAAAADSQNCTPPVDYPTIRSALGGGLGGFGTYFFGIDN